ncbi:hypothetical protein P170DRAFT_404383 [Aspergillus steynii IBT 23096]|uniref:Zn(2)-C6 fungal-type domain-containing protein n=1 Tax=Aspergillus steynii IBT 23096 TaxID=1392250 RepID=A0A2I2GKF4_9EURO|nr:uncharacterized protein P170DRAFT_404383 [Aspergillus steynii IBT 23096]PLB53355.1 hypothetical protein P170DRAFT_404383 [Aspergillus steynii IBT 23096]
MMSRRSETRRVHSLGGCKTCRGRHVRCDRNRPVCRQCTARSLTCEGYPEEIRWMPAEGDQSRGKRRKGKCDSGGSVGVRHYMYTEEHARRSMSNAINKDLLRGSVDVTLQEIDAYSCDPNFASKDHLIVGPFAVLNFEKPACLLEIEDIGPRTQDSNTSAYLTPPNDCLPTTVAPDISSYADGLLQWSDLFSFNDDLYGLASDLLMDCEVGIDSTPCPQIQSPKDALCDGPDLFQNITLNEPQMKLQLPPVDLSKEAGFLIRHFRKVIVPQLTVIPPSKSPWDTLNIPAALETLGQLTALGSESISHARLANFYSLQACAATHLATTPLTSIAEPNSKDYWKRVSEQAYAEAKHNMKLSLENESEGPKKAKFKDQMMALYGIAECAIFSCQQRDVRCYLMDAERLLRSRGFSKKKVSRKVRLLFNINTWLRIVGESTYVLHDHSSIESFVGSINFHCRPRESIAREHLTVSAPDQGIRLDDFLLFENIENNLNIDEPKDRRLDLRDIHLQDSRKSSESLSYQVYGMSETWLSLVSQTTRLANVMDALRAAQDAELPVAQHVIRAVQRREMRLENVIQFFVGRSSDTDHTLGRSAPYAHVLQALDSALVILFYRRVRRVHAAILETHISKVTHALDAFYSTLDEEIIPGPGTLWPLFIAGCEATTKVQREAVWDLVQRGEAKSGLAPYKLLKEIISEVWTKQDDRRTLNCSQPLPTWMDVLRLKQSWPVFA